MSGGPKKKDKDASSDEDESEDSNDWSGNSDSDWFAFNKFSPKLKLKFQINLFRN